MALDPKIPFFLSSPPYVCSKNHIPLLVATAKVLKSPASPSKMGSDPHLLLPISFPVAASKQ
jgi:hypothetical protein